MAAAADAYSLLALDRPGDHLPGGVFARWLQSLLWRPAFALVTIVLPLVLPDGRPNGRFWRVVLWGALAVLRSMSPRRLCCPDLWAAPFLSAIRSASRLRVD